MSLNLVIIDWDDTLFPSSWIKDTNIDLNQQNENLKLIFESIDHLINDLVYNLVDKCVLNIVSNGSHNWIKSCLNYLPYTSQIYDLEVFNIVSARDLFENDYPGGYDEWKKLAFKICLSENMNGEFDSYNVISIGDSDCEHKALMELEEWECSNDKNLILKSIKLKRRPELNELVEQLSILNKQILNILEHEENKNYRLYNKN